jgi:DNA-directed RNA polymerase specialized sigma24 family protein
VLAARVGEILADNDADAVPAPLAEGFGEERGVRGLLTTAPKPHAGPSPAGTAATATREPHVGAGSAGTADTATPEPHAATGSGGTRERRVAVGLGGGGSPEDAFDRLYRAAAAGLVRQVELLTGDPARARHAVECAYDLAWQRWPEVARDRDPVGWVRAAAYEQAFSPWQRWIPAWAPGGCRRQPRTPQGPLAAALLDLPPGQRTALLLHDGLGLDLEAAAGEVEATLPAAEARIAGARQALVEAVPDLEREALPERLGALLALPAGTTGAARTAELSGSAGSAEPGLEPGQRAAELRRASERGVRQRTLGAYALTAVIAVVTTVAVIVTPGHLSGSHPAGTPRPSASAHR